MSDDTKKTEETRGRVTRPVASRAHWDHATRDIQARLDKLEKTYGDLTPGILGDLIVVAQLEGFADWPDVERCARDHGHRVAIELLCRHRQRSAS